MLSAYLRGRHDQWSVHRWGESSTDDGQACITASLTRVPPEIATWAASLPEGLLVPEAWLSPYGRE